MHVRCRASAEFWKPTPASCMLLQGLLGSSCQDWTTNPGQLSFTKPWSPFGFLPFLCCPISVSGFDSGTLQDLVVPSPPSSLVNDNFSCQFFTTFTVLRNTGHVPYRMPSNAGPSDTFVSIRLKLQLLERRQQRPSALLRHVTATCVTVDNDLPTFGILGKQSWPF